MCVLNFRISKFQDFQIWALGQPWALGVAWAVARQIIQDRRDDPRQVFNKGHERMACSYAFSADTHCTVVISCKYRKYDAGTTRLGATQLLVTSRPGKFRLGNLASTSRKAKTIF